MLTAEDKKHIDILLDTMNEMDVTNEFIQTGILATISKENSFEPGRENMNYTAERLLEVFPSYFNSLSDSIPYAHQPEKIANYVYGGKYGNNTTGDGWKFRGGTYNQITFKDTYDRIGKQIGVDFVSDPGNIDQPEYAAKATVQYFKNAFDNSTQDTIKYGAKDINDFTDLRTAVDAALNANAGFGKNVFTVMKRNEAQAIAPEILKYIQTEYSKKKS